MAIAIDQALAKVIDETNASLSVTSASFTAPDNSVIVVVYYGDTNSAYSGAVTVTPSGGGLTYNQVGIREKVDSGGTSGYAGAHYAVNTSSQTFTVTTTATPAGSTQVKTLIAKVYVLTGADTTTPLDVNNEGSSTTNNLTTSNLTSSGNGMFFGVGNDWNALGAPTSSDLTEDSYHNGSFGSATSGYKTVSSGTVNGNLDAGGSGAADWNWISFVIAEAAAGGGAVVIGRQTIIKQAINRAASW